MQFCELLIPRLELVHRDSGSFPTAIETVLLPSDQLPGILLDSRNVDRWYRGGASGQNFMFIIHEPEGGFLQALLGPMRHFFESWNGEWSSRRSD